MNYKKAARELKEYLVWFQSERTGVKRFTPEHVGGLQEAFNKLNAFSKVEKGV